jgi:hypothetical protein
VPAVKDTPETTADRPIASVRLELLVAVIFSIFYFCDILLRASEKFFWYDELVTVYFARLPDFHTLWAALGNGIDFNPPSFYLLTRASNLLFGEGTIATRLPEIVGFWIFALCLYRFVNRRAGVLAGSIAMLLPMVTGAYFYASEARPHAVVLGFCGLALVFWQMASESAPYRRGALAGFAAALFGAFLMHCYAILLVTPFALVELVRSLRSKRIEWRAWIALAVPIALALPVYGALLRSFRKLQTATTFAQVALPGWSQAGHFYMALLEPCLIVFLAALVLFALDLSKSDSMLSGAAIRRDIGLAVAFLFLPAWGVVLGKVVHGPFFNRYFLSAVAGITIVIGAGAAWRGRHSWTARALLGILVAALLLSFSRLAIARLEGRGEPLKEPSSGLMLDTTPGQPLAMHPLLASDKSALPVAVIHPFEYLYLAHYAPAVRSRLYYVAASADDYDYAAFPRFFHCCARISNDPVLLSQFVREHQEYLVYGFAHDPSRIAALAAPGSCVESIVFRGEHFLAKMIRR